MRQLGNTELQARNVLRLTNPRENYTIMLNALTYAAVAARTGAEAAADTARERQDGAEVVQVVMIMGIFAIIIAVVFLINGGLRDQIVDLGRSVGEKIGVISDDVTAAPNG